jgi:DNA-binding Lrp family transcriptional regulator
VSTRNGLDDLDRALIEGLRADGRASNRSLAEALGVNEATVSSRLRRLEEDHVVRVVAVTDMEALGHELLAFAMVRVADRSVREVGAELAELAECIGVVITTGRVDLVLSVLARDRAHLAELVGSTIPKVRGVDDVRWELALQVLKFKSEWAVLGAEDHPIEPWAPTDAIDDLDLRIVRLLQLDARSSNRRIASELGVSEGTVRARIRRMEDEHIIHIQAISDVHAMGLGATAYVGITVKGGQLDKVAKALDRNDRAAAVIRSLGDFDLLVVLQATDRETLVATVLDEISALKGVRRTETLEACGVVKHSYVWAHLMR